jgi:Fur family peroxide stress response transcriptional regulator
MSMRTTEKAFSFERFERLCRQCGVPVTTQRRLIFDVLVGREDHPTADEIFDDVKARLPDLSRTTVYRVLDAFVRLGIISKVCHPGAAARFDPKTHRHHHLVCTQCERVFDVEDEGLDGLPMPDTRRLGFSVRDYRIELLGLCAPCARRERGSSRHALGAHAMTRSRGRGSLTGPRSVKSSRKRRTS